MLKEGNVTVMVSSLPRSIKFYTETLGFKLKYQVENEWAEIQAPGVTIGLHPAGEHGPKPGKNESLSIGFTVDNLDSAMANLKAKGVQFSPRIIEDGPVRIASFGDPDMTPLYICQVKGAC